MDDEQCPRNTVGVGPESQLCELVVLEIKESLGISVDVGIKGGIFLGKRGIFLRKIPLRPNNKQPSQIKIITICKST